MICDIPLESSTLLSSSGPCKSSSSLRYFLSLYFLRMNVARCSSGAPLWISSSKGRLAAQKPLAFLFPIAKKSYRDEEQQSREKKENKKTNRRDRNVQKSVSKMCCDAPLIKLPNNVQTSLASYGWHWLVPPQGRCSRCCCPTSSSALWRDLGQGNDAALQDGQREESTIGLHTQQTNQKLFIS